MKYISTRGRAPTLGFCDTVMTGLASDGGLYLPERWPEVSPDEIAGFANRPFAEVATDLIARFTGGEIADADLGAIAEAAYGTFRHPSTTPLVELSPGLFVLELFHGPTLAFKDVAMQFLARVMDHILTARGKRATIVGATSGDTGSAAIEAFRGRDNIDIFIMHPRDRTSEVQRRQMTTVLADNVHNIAIEGTFDDCQALLKGLFNNKDFRERASLGAVNSINWGRIVAQTVYYFTAAAALGSPWRKVDFTVPTGNFGDIFAGEVARRMGLPIGKLVIATNENDILKRTLDTGRYEVDGVRPTMSPSMDIQVSSNFERLVFESCGRDGAETARLIASLGQSGSFALPEKALAQIRAGFAAGTTNEAETAAAMKAALDLSLYLADPHTAVGLGVATRFRDAARPMIALSTAHPAKFPAAVASATGVEPALPVWLAGLMDREERLTLLPNDLKTLEDFVSGKSRAWEE
ncbi:MAG: threonine synthase [Alphaproteobacteria bacterium]|nr:threonine synthase [Alphaproteobacteria bacterium]